MSSLSGRALPDWRKKVYGNVVLVYDVAFFIIYTCYPLSRAMCQAYHITFGTYPAEYTE